MTSHNPGLALRLASANQAAKRDFINEDLTSPVAACPARQSEVFIVPVRYALAEQAAGHPSFQPGVVPESHPMAVRRLRTGYLYIWHPDSQLQRYAIASDGLLTEQALDAPGAPVMKGIQAGLALNKQHDAWLMFSEISLPGSASQRLAESADERQVRMRRIRLTQVAGTLTAAHCPPLDQSDQLMAELMPETRARALAHAYPRHADAYREEIKVLGQRLRETNTPEHVKNYVETSLRLGEYQQAAVRYPESQETPPGEWSAIAWDVLGTDAWLAQARREADQLHAVFACLDDDLGVLRDINHEQEYVEAGHEGWVADNNLRQSVGGFIRSLIREDGGEVSNLLNYRYRDHDIQLTREQSEFILESQRQLESLFKEESRINQERGRQYSHTQADAELAHVHSEVASVVASVRGILPAELNNEAQQLIREYRKEKAANLAGGRTTAEVAKHIDLQRMDAWLDEEAPAHYHGVAERHKALYADRSVYLYRHGSGTWFVDHNDPENQCWLDELAQSTLSAQCHRREGVVQLAGYLGSDSAGSLRLIFHAWSPTLEAAVNSTARLSELSAALSLDNLASTRAALAGVLNEATLRSLERLAADTQGYWSNTVARLGAALLAAQSQTGLAGQWMGLFAVTRLGQDARLVRTIENGAEVWRLLGQKAEALQQWTRSTAQAIRSGQVAGILQSPVIRNSGGLLPLAALLLNSLNASNYASQARLLEGESDQRRAARLSASLYAAAALTAVVQNWVVVGKGVQEMSLARGQFSFTAPTLTLFGGVVGIISAAAASNELNALELQIENSRTRVDPWLELRKLAVTGQMVVYGAQGLLGLSLTSMRLANMIDTPTAIRHFRLSMGPVNLLLLGLGGLYIYAWSRQATPLQNYLASCCWSHGRAYKQEQLAPEAQLTEFEQLLALLYKPRLTLQTQNMRIPGTLGDTVTQDGITALSIDLPAGDPNSVLLELALSGTPTPFKFIVFKDNRGTPADLGAAWLNVSRCIWIPAEEGQGLRLSGSFVRPLNRASLRLRYHSPLALLAGMESVIGGPKGIAYTLGPDGLLTEGEVIELRRDDPTPELNSATPHRLDGTQYLQPRTLYEPAERR